METKGVTIEQMDEWRTHLEKSHEAKTSELVGGFVYLVKCNDHYKIGRTNNIQQRMKTFGKILLPFDFELIYSVPCRNSKHTEKCLHNWFAVNRVKGEWFKFDAHDLSFVKMQMRMLCTSRPHTPEEEEENRLAGIELRREARREAKSKKAKVNFPTC